MKAISNAVRKCASHAVQAAREQFGRNRSGYHVMAAQPPRVQAGRPNALRRLISYVFTSTGGHVQVHFSAREQQQYGLPPAVGLMPGYFTQEPPYYYYDGRIKLPELDTAAAERVKDAFGRVEKMRAHDRRNIVAPNCVHGAAEIVGAALGTENLAPLGTYVGGPELGAKILEHFEASGLAPPEVDSHPNPEASSRSGASEEAPVAIVANAKPAAGTQPLAAAKLHYRNDFYPD